LNRIGVNGFVSPSESWPFVVILANSIVLSRQYSWRNRSRTSKCFAAFEPRRPWPIWMHELLSSQIATGFWRMPHSLTNYKSLNAHSIITDCIYLFILLALCFLNIHFNAALLSRALWCNLLALPHSTLHFSAVDGAPKATS